MDDDGWILLGPSSVHFQVLYTVAVLVSGYSRLCDQSQEACTRHRCEDNRSPWRLLVLESAKLEGTSHQTLVCDR